MTPETLQADPTALGRFQALVMANPALAERLNRIDDAGRFVEQIVESAAAHGVPLAAEAVRAATRPDPLGLARWAAPPLDESASLPMAWPPRQWLPIHIAALGGRIFVDWAYFGAEPLRQPFFEDSIRRAMHRPFNRMFRYRMPFDDFLEPASRAQSLKPSGFIFHMSRCGSTLVSQMLAALSSNVVISEAAPIDAVLRIDAAWTDLPADSRIDRLIAIIAAYGRRRAGCERHYFIKLDSWHALALPLFRRAFPSVPWVFLYREPTEVLVSQMRQPGMQMIPDIMAPGIYGIDGADTMPPDEYRARVLNTICLAAADHAAGGLLVNYRELPDALWTKILPHFGVTFGEGERETMNRAARQDAKAPSIAFVGDSESKQRQAPPALRALAERHVGAVYRKLEALRLGEAV